MPRRAFTILELLVVIAIVALLVAFLVVSLRSVRASSSRTESLGALRQMAIAYQDYAHDHKGRLLPGYTGELVFDLGHQRRMTRRRRQHQGTLRHAHRSPRPTSRLIGHRQGVEGFQSVTPGCL